MIIMEKPANVSVIAVTYNYKIYFHNIIYSGTLQLYVLFALIWLECIVGSYTKLKLYFIFWYYV